MYLIIDFGLTKLANKIKKKNWDKSLTDKGVRTYRKRHSPDNLIFPNFLGKNKAGEDIYRGMRGNNSREALGLPELTRKPKSGEIVRRSIVKKEMIPDNKNFTDIRKVDDKALSSTGYVGYKNTPNSYFEEAVPMIETGKKTKVKDRKRLKYS